MAQAVLLSRTIAQTAEEIPTADARELHGKGPRGRPSRDCPCLKSPETLPPRVLRGNVSLKRAPSGAEMNFAARAARRPISECSRSLRPSFH